MSTTACTLDHMVLAPAAPAFRSRRAAGDTVRIVGLASITVALLAGSAAPTPLYATYQLAWAFSSMTTTVIFGIYAVSLLATLLVAGRLSDHLGRRPVLLAGVAGQVVAMLLFTGATGVGWLVAARIVQGAATGVAIGAIGAGMLDVDPARGAVANSTAPGLGTATGALLSAFLVQWFPAPTHLVYWVLIVVLVAQAVWVSVAVPETSPMTPGMRQSLVPRMAVPRQTRKALLVAAPVLFAVWALAGFYGSLGPAVVAHLVGSESVVEGGLGLGILAGIAAAATYILRNLPPSSVMLIGTSTLTAGVAIVLGSVGFGSPIAFFIGTAIAGFGFGAGFQGGIRLVAPLALPDERAGILSVLYIISYLGLGVPAIVAGIAVVRGGGLIATTYEYGAAVIALAVLATVNLFRLDSREITNQEVLP